MRILLVSEKNLQTAPFGLGEFTLRMSVGEHTVVYVIAFDSDSTQLVSKTPRLRKSAFYEPDQTTSVEDEFATALDAIL